MKCMYLVVIISLLPPVNYMGYVVQHRFVYILTADTYRIDDW